jgi:mono/diheme cytochrome c family protein
LTVIPSLPVVRPVVATLLALLCASAPGGAAAQTRGELLYGTHCLACHTQQMHWRQKKQVIDWPSLRAQVRRWQAADQLAWGDDDIEAVAQYLNTLFYRLPLPGARAVASAAPVPLPVPASR